MAIEEPSMEDVIEIVSGSLLLALVLFLFVDVGTLIYSGVALLATGMLLLGFLYKLRYRRFDLAFFISGLLSPVSLVLIAVFLVGGGAVVGGALGLILGIIGSIFGVVVGGIIGVAVFYLLQTISYFAYLIFGIII